MSRTELAAGTPSTGRAWCGVAYAILGSRAEAEDVVADCWLRLVAADAREPVRDVLGWATVAVLAAPRSTCCARPACGARPTSARGCPSRSSARPRRDPADRVTLDDTVRYALLVVLEQLTPAERTAWVLHDLFGMPFPEVARAVGRTPGRRAPARAPRPGARRRRHPARRRRRRDPRAGRSAPSCWRRPAATWPAWSRCSTRRSC